MAVKAQEQKRSKNLKKTFKKQLTNPRGYDRLRELLLKSGEHRNLDN